MLQAGALVCSAKHMRFQRLCDHVTGLGEAREIIVLADGSVNQPLMQKLQHTNHAELNDRNISSVLKRVS